MKEASVVVHLSKDHNVVKHHITPLEALLLVAEHNRNYGACPVEIIEGTEVEVTRSDNDELVRLRGKYHKTKVQKVKESTAEVPKSFAEALKLGMGIETSEKLGVMTDVGPMGSSQTTTQAAAAHIKEEKAKAAAASKK